MPPFLWRGSFFDKFPGMSPLVTTIVTVSTAPLGKNRLSGLELDFVSLVARGDDGMAQVVISKTAPDKQEDDMGDLISKDDLDSEVVAYIEGLESENETLTKSVDDKDEQIETLKADLKKAEDSGLVVKSEDEQFKALLEKAEPSVRVLLQKQADDLAEQKAVAKAERDLRLDKEFVAKAETMPMLNTDKTALGSLLRRLSDALSTEDAETVEKMLTTANNQIAKGNLFSEMGRGGGQSTVSKSADAAAAEIRKANPSLTEDQALAQAYQDNPDLFAQAMTNQEG